MTNDHLPTRRRAQAQPRGDEPQPRRKSTPVDYRPTVEQLSEASFPASDPPPAWTWEPRRPAS